MQFDELKRRTCGRTLNLCFMKGTRPTDSTTAAIAMIGVLHAL